MVSVSASVSGNYTRSVYRVVKNKYKCVHSTYVLFELKEVFHLLIITRTIIIPLTLVVLVEKKFANHGNKFNRIIPLNVR